MTDSTSPATTVIDQFYAHLNSGDLDRAVALLSDDYVGHWGLGSGGNGPDQARNQLGTWYRGVPDLQMEVTQTITDGEWVASFVILTGTQTGDFGPIPSSGKPIRTASVDMLRVHDGQIVEGRTICDVGSVLIAAGAVPALAH